MKNKASLSSLFTELVFKIETESEFGVSDYENGEDFADNFAGVQNKEWTIELEYSCTTENGFSYGRIDALRVYGANDEGEMEDVNRDIYDEIYHDISDILEDLN